MEEKWTRVVIHDPHGNTVADRPLSPEGATEQVSEHNADPNAHTDIREGIVGLRTQIERRLVGAKVTFSDGHTEDVELGFNEQGEVILLLPKETFGKIDGVKVNGEELEVDDNGKVDIPIPQSVHDLDPDDEYATKEDAQAMVNEAKVTGVTMNYQEDGGLPSATVDFNEGSLDFLLKNMKMKFSDLSNDEKEALRGKQGRPGADKQPVEGSIIIAHSIGGSEEMVMDQKSVTDELLVVKSSYDIANHPGANLCRIDGNGLWKGADATHEAGYLLSIQDYIGGYVKFVPQVGKKVLYAFTQNGYSNSSAVVYAEDGQKTTITSEATVEIPSDAAYMFFSYFEGTDANVKAPSSIDFLHTVKEQAEEIKQQAKQQAEQMSDLSDAVESVEELTEQKFGENKQVWEQVFTGACTSSAQTAKSNATAAVTVGVTYKLVLSTKSWPTNYLSASANCLVVDTKTSPSQTADGTLFSFKRPANIPSTELEFTAEKPYIFITFRADEGEEVTLSLVQCSEWNKVKEDITNAKSDIEDLQEAVTSMSMGVQDYDAICKSINHRGGYGLACPENSLVGIRRAYDLGYRWCEVDTRLTSDGIPILIHDESINDVARNADGTAISGTVNIADITFEEACEYDWGVKISSSFAGMNPTTLEECCLFMRRKGMHLVLEFKTMSAEEQQIVYNVIKSTGLKDYTIISAQINDIATYAGIDADSDIGYLVSAAGGAPISTYKTQLDTIQASHHLVLDVKTSVLSDYLNTAIGRGYEVWVYTPADTATIIGLDPRVRGMTTDNLLAGKIIYDNA